MYILDVELTFMRVQNVQFTWACTYNHKTTVLFNNVFNDNLTLHKLHFITAHFSFVTTHLCIILCIAASFQASLFN